MLDSIKVLYLPYTVIDVGWLSQLSLPELPSGRVKGTMMYAMKELCGDGDVPFALLDTRDIGKYVARIIADPQTLNKSVFAYGEIWTQNQIFQALEEASGEKTVKKIVSC